MYHTNPSLSPFPLRVRAIGKYDSLLMRGYLMYEKQWFDCIAYKTNVGNGIANVYWRGYMYVTWTGWTCRCWCSCASTCAESSPCLRLCWTSSWAPAARSPRTFCSSAENATEIKDLNQLNRLRRLLLAVHWLLTTMMNSIWKRLSYGYKKQRIDVKH